MKRLIVCILAVLYFGVSTGTTVHLHYCMGKLVGMALWEDDEDDCSRCGMKKKNVDNGCCKNVHKIVKSNAQHMLAKVGFEATPQFFAIIPQPVTYSYTAHIAAVEPKCIVQAHAPPDDRRCCPIYISVRNFRI